MDQTRSITDRQLLTVTMNSLLGDRELLTLGRLTHDTGDSMESILSIHFWVTSTAFDTLYHSFGR